MIQFGSKDSTPEYLKNAREVHGEVSLLKTTESRILSIKPKIYRRIQYQ